MINVTGKLVRPFAAVSAVAFSLEEEPTWLFLIAGRIHYLILGLEEIRGASVCNQGSNEFYPDVSGNVSINIWQI